jgi:type IV secretory pathway TraG/TraD family ATPase VirD4
MNRDYLETPLFPLPPTDEGNNNTWKVRNAVEGVQIFGGIGSGKTSGSGRTLALKYLKAGFGGLVLTVKPDEVDLWREYCQLSGRSNDLVVIEPDGKHKFDFLLYDSIQNSGGKPITENIHQTLKTVINANENKSSGTQDRFWDDALDMLLINLIDLCVMGFDRVTIDDLYKLAETLPNISDEESSEERQKQESESHYSKAIKAAARKKEEKIIDERLFKVVDDFFNSTYQSIGEKTRSTIEMSFLGVLFRMLREPIFTLFCSGEITIKPEECRQGKIIVINLPVKVYSKVGRDCQIMFKYIWQRAMERTLANNDQSRVVFLWADEAQNFIHEHDADFQATARSSQVATVYLTQNLPNYYANMGGAKYRYKTQSFLGTLATKFFHANADTETNEYASKLIGKTDRVKKSQGFTDGINNDSESINIQIERDELVRPEQFTRLDNGGVTNNKMVEAYAHFQGNVLGGQQSHTLLTFNQDFLP